VIERLVGEGQVPVGRIDEAGGRVRRLFDDPGADPG
jgi:hypothetical protein